MAFIQCPHCGKHISDLAPACTFCQASLSIETSAGTAATRNDENVASPAAACSVASRQIIFVFLGVFVCIYALVSLLGWGRTDRDMATVRDRHAEKAYYSSQDYVRAHLKAPSSAKFPWYDPAYVQRTGQGKFEVRAYVDAQNAFGAPIRSHYFCELQSTDGERWTLKNIVFF